MTSDEFREGYDRSCDVAKVKRSQLDGDIPWDLLQFSVSFCCCLFVCLLACLFVCALICLSVRLLSSFSLPLSWCFTTTETVWLIKDGRKEERLGSGTFE